LITGATGFLGGRLVRALLRAGAPPERLRCLVREPARARSLGLPDRSLVAGDLARDGGDASLAAAVRDVAAVVHLAGAVKGLCAADYDAVNVDGTARLCAALRASAPHAFVVCVSSLAAAGPSVDGTGSDAPAEHARPVSWYGDSKRRSELAVVRSGLAHTIVRPPAVYGPGDAATRLLFRQACAPFVVVPRVPRPLSVIHADDVVAALRRTLVVRPAGAVLPLDGAERTDTHALMRAIAASRGRRARLLPVPIAVAAAAATFVDLIARWRRCPGFFSRDKVKEIAACGWVADGGPAERALAFRPGIRLADGLAAVCAEERAAVAAAAAAAV
jgi:nucleoside-diphosphate-sugar epimerase